jgi:hypothetical protein
VAREIQSRVLDRRLHALAAFLYRCIWQTDNDNGRQAVRVIHFHFNDDAFKADDSTGMNTGKHGGESRRGNSKCQLTASICRGKGFSVQLAQGNDNQIQL